MPPILKAERLYARSQVARNKARCLPSPREDPRHRPRAAADPRRIDQSLPAFLWSVADLLRGDYTQSDDGEGACLSRKALRVFAAADRRVLRDGHGGGASCLVGAKVCRTPLMHGRRRPSSGMFASWSSGPHVARQRFSRRCHHATPIPISTQSS